MFGLSGRLFSAGRSLLAAETRQGVLLGLGDKNGGEDDMNMYIIQQGYSFSIITTRGGDMEIWALRKEYVEKGIPQ